MLCVRSEHFNVGHARRYLGGLWHRCRISRMIQMIDLVYGSEEKVAGSPFEEGLCAGSQRNIFGAQFSPSGKLAYIETDECYDMMTGGTSVGNQRIVDASSGRTFVELPEILAIAWSPDERWIAYSADENLRAVEVETGATVELYAGVGRIFNIVWNPASPAAEKPISASTLVALEPALLWNGDIYRIYYMPAPDRDILTARQFFNSCPVTIQVKCQPRRL